MTALKLFISYARVDMQPVHWVERLGLYLAPGQRDKSLDVWDDSRIQPGQLWEPEIRRAMDSATAAIFVVGPGFLASEFVNNVELPRLLEAAKGRGVRIYPLIVGHCLYKESVLGAYEAFNDPNTPLESLPTADQNKHLNDLARLINADARTSHETAGPNDAGTALSLTDPLEKLIAALRKTSTAFNAQAKRRNQLVEQVRSRLGIDEPLEYERFFIKYHPSMDNDELFQFQQIRAMTEGPMFEGNRDALDVLERHAHLFDANDRLVDLQQHLVFWLNKYDRVFLKRDDMCLLYTGVEDDVPFPSGIDDELEELLTSDGR